MMNTSRHLRFLTRRLAVLAKLSRRGAAAVEFALLVPVVVVGLTYVADLGRSTFQKIEMESAARAGAQMAIRDRANTSAIEQTTVDSTNLTITTNDVSVSNICRCADIDDEVDCSATCTNLDPLQFYTKVTVTKSFTHLILPLPDKVLVESVTVRTQ